MKRFLRITGRLLLGFTGLTLLLVLFFKWVPVPVTPLMVIRTIQQKMAGKPAVLKYDWVSVKKISPNLQLAVICSEDQNFVRHRGFDMKAIRKVLDETRNEGGRPRGASTISQQTAKNLFLWPGRSWIRKGLEVWFTSWIELFWSKKRILEVYLNVIETGDGVYGAAAASHHHFGISPDRLSKRQAAALAAVLPNPRRYQAANPGPYVSGRINWIERQMAQYGPLELKPEKKKPESKGK